MLLGTAVVDSLVSYSFAYEIIIL